MKSLESIQKTFQVFQKLTKVAMILAFVASGMLLVGLVCGVVISSAGAAVSGGMETLYELTASASFHEMIGTLLVDFVLTLTDAILLKEAFLYFSAEQEDGTPFTHRGADLLKRLGILLLVLPAVAAILGGIFYGIFDLSKANVAELGNGTSVAMGIMLILMSLIIRYGAEVQNQIEGKDV